ncbi:MAG: hypothetical protein IKU03_10230 [Bacteroidales bacterium]|nr:hypothetical protein [Bacteroidales bacterium]
MKKLFSVLAVAAMVVFTLTSCEKPEPTKADYLCQDKGWVLSAATSTPAYDLSDGTHITDLMTEGYLYAYELDDIITFNANGTMSIKPGANIDPVFGYQQEVGSTWAFNADTTVLYFQIPFFYNEDGTSFDAELENAKILYINENEMKLAYTFNDDLGAKGEYTFYLTYVPAK